MLGEVAMYFWKIKNLREHLIQGGLSQHALFVYVLLNVIFYEAMLEATGLFPTEGETTSIDWLWALINTLAVATGTWLCYYFNGGASGKEFAERYFSISFVVSLRVIALMLPVMSVGFIIFLGEETEGDAEGQAELWTNVIALIWAAGYYWRVITHINVVARARKS